MSDWDNNYWQEELEKQLHNNSYPKFYGGGSKFNYQPYYKQYKSDDIKWVEKGILARSPRPGYPSESVSKKDVNDFIARAKKMGIKSIICFLQPKEFKGFYKSIGDLSDYYYKNGFRIINVPVQDFKNPAMSGQELQRASQAFKYAEKPVLVHCSAGQDRTGAFVRNLVDFLKECVKISEREELNEGSK